MSAASKSSAKPLGFGAIDLILGLPLNPQETGLRNADLIKLAVASGQGLCEDQQGGALPLARCKSWRRSAAKLRNQTLILQSCDEIPKDINEAL